MALPTDSQIQVFYAETKRLPLKNVKRAILPGMLTALKAGSKRLGPVGLGLYVAYEVLDETGVIDWLKQWVIGNEAILEANQTVAFQQVLNIAVAELEDMLDSTNGKRAYQNFIDGKANAIYHTTKYTEEASEDWSRNTYQSKASRRSLLKNVATTTFRKRFSFKKNR
jgi:hypothetical protein|tara:strand:+ start:704 stop:1207 length:504 start_codon:yes stop_codon:yes gene_type:complete